MTKDYFGDYTIASSSVRYLREGWLRVAAQRIIDDILAPAGYSTHFESGETLALRVKITCGWPSKGGLSRKRQVLGECWAMANSVDNISEIFISPTVDDSVRALDILTHELGHAAVGTHAKHNRTFALYCHNVGLEGKPSATVAGEELTERLNTILASLPTYPHGRLILSTPKAVQGTRDRKAYCDNDACPSIAASPQGDGFKTRLTKFWMRRYAVEWPRGEDPHDERVLPERIGLRCPDCDQELAIEQPPEE